MILRALVLHFHLFFGVAVLEKRIDVRQNVEGDRMRINFRDRRLSPRRGFDLSL